MKSWAKSVWKRAIALFCSFAMIVTFLPAQPLFAETSNGYTPSISADKNEADVGDTITFKASVEFKAEESTDTEAEDFSVDWYLDGEKKESGEKYELSVSSLENSEKEFEVYCVARGKTSGSKIKSNTEKVTFYNLYSIEFAESDEDTIKTRNGKEITLPTPSKNGNRFVEWKKGDSTYEAGSTYTVDGDATFTAVWQETVTVSFDPAGGTMDEAKKSVTIDKGATVPSDNLGAVPDYAGHDFQGWYLGENKYSNTEITEDTTLTAHWETQEFNVTDRKSVV